MDPLLILLGAIEIQKKLNYPVSRLQTFMRGGLLQALVHFYHCWERNNLTQLENQQGWGCHRPSHMRMVASGTGQQSQPQASHLDSTKKCFGPLATNIQGHQRMMGRKLVASSSPKKMESQVGKHTHTPQRGSRVWNQVMGSFQPKPCHGSVRNKSWAALRMLLGAPWTFSRCLFPVG